MGFTEKFSLKRIGAVTRHELRVLFYSPLTYLFQAGFLLVLGLCVFQVADFYASDEASMDLWILFMPWIGLVFMPALAMHAWPDEHTDRTVELALTLPVAAVELVCGKYLAGIIVLLVTLAFSLVFPATLAWLGEPDWGVVVASLLASFLLLALYFAIALSAASLLGDAISVFVISTVALFLLVLTGTSELESLLEPVFSGNVLRTIYALSPRPHFESIASGLVKLSEVSYFLLGIVVLLMFCSAAVTVRRYGRLSDAFRPVFLLKAIGLLVIAGLLQTMLKALPLEIDWTEHREFTLSPTTVNQIRGAREEIRIDFFWSEQQSNVPASIRSHANRIRNLLERIEYHSQGNVVMRHFDPVPDTDYELAAIESGMRAVPMTSGDYFYLGLTMRHKDRTHALAYIDKERGRFLEYDLLSAISRLINPRTIRVGMLSPLLPPTTLDNPRPGLLFVEELKRRNDVVLVPFFADQLPDQVDVLIVLQGAALKRAMLYAIDQHVMRGGALIALLDPSVHSDKASNEIRFQPSTEINDLSDLLLSWGVRYAGDRIVGDAQLASPVLLSADGTRISYPYWLRFDKENMRADHPVTGALNEVLLAEAGSLEITDAGVARPLLMTTIDSGSYLRDDYRNKGAYELAADFKIEDDQHIVAAVIEGSLKSAYEDPDSITANPGHLNASRNSRVFVVADSDWLFDSFALHTTNLGSEVITRPLNDNFALLENMIAYGAGSDFGNIPVRGPLSRPFTRVAGLFKNVEREVKASERSTVENVTALEKRLAEIRRVSGVEDLSELPSPLREQALPLQKQLVAMRRDLRNIRLRIRERIDQLGKTLAALNIVSGPFLVFIFGTVVLFLRRSKHHNREARKTRLLT